MAPSLLRYEPFHGPGMVLRAVFGHPRKGHDILFLATQVLNAAGVTDGKRQVQRYKGIDGMYQIRTLLHELCGVDVDAGVIPTEGEIGTFIAQTMALVGPRWRDAWVFTEPVMYRVLFRGYAPMTEPFRRWITAIVLPTLRRTGAYTYEHAHYLAARRMAYEACHARAQEDTKYAARWTKQIEKLLEIPDPLVGWKG